jgi:hypothetical protein
MRIRVKLIVLFMVTWGILGITSPARPAVSLSDLEALVRGFPALDELEAHLGLATQGEGINSRTASKAPVNPEGSAVFTYPVSARWFTAPQTPGPFGASPSTHEAEPGDKPLATLLADLVAAQKEAGAIGKEIGKQNNLLINQYLALLENA